MSKATIDAVKEAEARAEKILSDAEIKAKAIIAEAEKNGKALCETAEAEADADYRAKIDEVNKKTAEIVKAQRKKITDQSKLQSVEAERRLSEAKRQIIRRVGEICQ